MDKRVDTLTDAQLKWSTPVDVGRSRVRVSFHNPLLMLGSCFADNIGGRMRTVGFDALVNPLGTMYNPLSILDTLRRIDSATPFTRADCVPVGAGDGRVCSFYHHTRHARPTPEELLADANAGLASAHEHWARCETLIVTLGTAWCFRHNGLGRVVGNCLKHVAGEFTRFRMAPADCADALRQIVDIAGPRGVIFTVSPIRHKADGAHGNQLSKSTLLLAVDDALGSRPSARADYFPAYEILMDELRDYRFYADDMAHPSSMAEDYVYRRFMDFALPPVDRPALQDGERQARRMAHVKMS